MLPAPGDDDTEAIPAALDTQVPNVSRVYNRWLGGQDNFSADRTAADTLSSDFPEIAQVARANRLFVLRAVRHVAARGITAAMAPGSYLILSSGTTTGTNPMIVARLSAAYQGHTTVAGRTTTEIAGYFAGLDLEPPGLVDVWAWRPDREENWPPAPGLRFLGGVARKPVSRRACWPR